MVKENSNTISSFTLEKVHLRKVTLEHLWKGERLEETPGGFGIPVVLSIHQNTWKSCDNFGPYQRYLLGSASSPDVTAAAAAAGSMGSTHQKLLS
jgi:hypothetical protein